MSGWTLVPEPSAAASGWTPVAEPPPAPPPAKGGWEGVKRGLSNIAHMPGAILDAISKPPQNEDEEKMHTLGGSGALAIHRLIAAPMAQQRELAKKYQTQATGSEATPPEKLGFDFSLTGSTPQEKAQHLANLHNIASVVPMLGPMVGDLTERFLGIGEHEGNPDKSGALAEGATYVAAPEAAKGLLKAAPVGWRAVGNAMPEAVKNYTPAGDIPGLIKRTVAGQTIGRLPGSSLVEQVTGSKVLARPTLAEWWKALQPDKQMSLFKSMPKLGDTPISPETHPATLSLLQETAPATAEATAAKPFQASGSTVPRVYTGEAVINDALTSLDKPTLMRIAKSRGIDTTTEANLIPSKAEASLVKKIGSNMTQDELDEARDVGLEVSRNKPVPGQDLGKKAMQEAWHYKVVKQFFPDVELPQALEKRAQATIAKRPASADYTPVYRAAAQKASPGASDAEIKAKATDLQAQDENMEALLRESITQAQAKTEATATAEGRSAQAEAARAGSKYMNPSPAGFGKGAGIENTEEGARLIRERAERTSRPPITTQRMMGKGPELERYDEYLDYLRDLEQKAERGEPLPKNQMSHDEWLQAEAAKRQPWQMTREEYVGKIGKAFQKAYEDYNMARPGGLTRENHLKMMMSGAKVDHQYLVGKALDAGKPVPAEVLKDYPEIDRYRQELKTTRAESLETLRKELREAKKAKGTLGEMR